MKHLITVIFFYLVVIGAQAQTKKDIFDPNVNVTWVGVDFTGAKIIGDREKLATQSDLVNLINGINQLLVKEADKYNVADAMDRKTVKMAIDVANDHNASLEVNDMFSDKASDHLSLTPAGVQTILENYDFKDNSGLGVIINVGSFNKLEEEAVLYFTIFNIDTKEVLITQQYLQKPGGFGIKNFWARTIYDTIERVKKKDFNTWRKKYSS